MGQGSGTGNPYVCDFHVHIHGPYRSAANLLCDLDRHGVTDAVVLASPVDGSGAATVPLWYGRTVGRSAPVQFMVRRVAGGSWLGIRERPNNEEVQAVVEAGRGRLRWLFFANPYLPDAAGELHSALTDGGAVGLKLHLWTYPIGLLDPRIRRLVDVTAEHAGIVLVDLGSQPRAFDEIARLARSYPSVRFVIPHLPPPLEKVLRIAEAHDNVLLDTSSPQVSPRHVRRAIDRIGCSRIVFGSDAPREMGGDMRYSRWVIDALALDRDSYLSILGGNARREATRGTARSAR
jgi:predicted TIM-barrel fold metal-dependent hydrolase